MIIYRVYHHMVRCIRRRLIIFLIMFIILWPNVYLLVRTIARKLHKSTFKDGYGNYDYRPGLFLEGVQPRNESYCQFNYGLPGKFNWRLVEVLNSPQMGSSSPYRVIYNAIKGTAYINKTKSEIVTYCTQATPEFLYHIVEIARYWDGPISLAVYVPRTDLDLTMQILKHLCNCYSSMSKVSVHLFYPNDFRPVILHHKKPKEKNINRTEEFKRKIRDHETFANKSRAEYVTMVRQKKIQTLMIQNKIPYVINFNDCSGMDFSTLVTFRKDNHMLYPINVGRNVARNASVTNYFIVSDIEMVPSDKLAQEFPMMLDTLTNDRSEEEGQTFAKSIFVVPLFEVERGEVIPRDKETLVRLVIANRAFYFHQKSCSHCQRFPGVQTWLGRPAPATLQPMLVSKREYPYHRWEPLYFGTSLEPWYDELLSWEGKQDKMAQMAELCLLDYRLIVLDGGFLCHAAPPHPPSRHDLAVRANAQHYNTIVKKLLAKYKHRPQCKLDS